MTHNSIARYGVLILLVAFISILYFATTHQVLRPAGSGPSINSESYATNDTGPIFQNQEIFDQNDGEVIQYGDIRKFPRKETQGYLYNRGDGCSIISVEKNIPLPSNEDRVGLISLDERNCNISTKIQNSIQNGTRNMIFWSSDKQDYGKLKTAFEIYNDRNDRKDRQKDKALLVFSVNKNTSDEWIKQLNDLYDNYANKSSGLRVTLRSSQPIYASSWLFAMFAVGGVLVVSFFISILIHLRIYRRRQSQEEEIERQRSNEDSLGMKKWTLDKETVDAFPVIIYSTKISSTEKEPKSNNNNNDGDDDGNVKVEVENVKVEDEKVNGDENKNIKSDEEIKNVKIEDEKSNDDEKVEKANDDDENKNTKSEEDSKKQSDNLRRHYSLRSIRSFRSTRSTKSTKSQRSVKAISNAIALYASPSVETRTEGSTEESPIDLIANSETRETCAICLEDFDDGDEIRELPCRHWYHVECIDPWLTTKSSSCPLCKNDCKPKNLSEGDGNVQGNTIVQERESQTTQVIDNQDSPTNPSIRGNNTVTHLMINALDLLFGSRQRMRRRRGQQNDIEIGNTTSTTSNNV
ncbi:7350_t:CDS:2 [Diversispora eburnea]|uniref:7350_t:CDS:1 n=1 Tax=Diversispora eburnea TaxID=1213867 RepID=A0A9N8UV15_9GLOM|nr:7350_t:CDS:2 [Diversispora eburnea]